MERFFAENPTLQTPYLVMDLDVVCDRYLRLRQALHCADIYYAVKANPDPIVLRTLANLGSRFDVASIGELDRCLDLGIDPSVLSFGNTIKHERDIAGAVERQVTLFAVDCDEELTKILRQTTHGTVLVRLATTSTSAEWPLNDKFGCAPEQAEHLLLRAADNGVHVGVSFHVGSQQRDLTAWEAPLAEAAALAESLAQRGHQLSTVNLGGGIPGNHLRRTSPIEDYGSAIAQALQRHLGGLNVHYMIEPGRYLVSDAGIIRSEVLLVTEKLIDQGRRWVYLNVGRYNGLAETEDEAIRYRMRCPRATGALMDSVVAGPTCDSADIIYENEPYPLPSDLMIGDYVDVLSAGAYTASYASVWFNGFEPLKTYHLPASLPVELPVK
ncbi:MAG: type III PLP-dependent enzyme [Mycobacteriaceae bacterium]|nr:type III PLP-dependent enzyme [Mycobacteriaceae bacterium]